MSNPHRYEIDSLRGWPIVIFIGGAIACLALSFWVVEKTLRRLEASTPPPAATSLVNSMPHPGNAPKLQPTEAVDHSAAGDLEALRSREDDIFARLGWAVDRGKHQATMSDQLIQQVIRLHQSEVGK